MITSAELNPHNYETTSEIDSNLAILRGRINLVRAAWNKSMIVTSALRSERQQASLVKAGISTATKSNHLTWSAAAMFDRDRWIDPKEGIELELISTIIQDRKALDAVLKR